jgi:hypothetical protein
MSNLNHHSLLVNPKSSLFLNLSRNQMDEVLDLLAKNTYRMPNLGRSPTVRVILKHLALNMNSKKKRVLIQDGKRAYFDPIWKIRNFLISLDCVQSFCKRTFQYAIALLKKLGLICVYQNEHLHALKKRTNFYTICYDKVIEILESIGVRFSFSKETDHGASFASTNILSKASYVSKAKALPKYNKKNTILSEESEKGAQPFVVASPFSLPRKQNKRKTANDVMIQRREYERNRAETALIAPDLSVNRETCAKEPETLAEWFKSITGTSSVAEARKLKIIR